MASSRCRLRNVGRDVDGLELRLDVVDAEAAVPCGPGRCGLEGTGVRDASTGYGASRRHGWNHIRAG